MMTLTSRILAVDPGQRRLGIALSDETGSVARPLLVLPHHSLSEDAERIVALARAHSAGLVLVGLALDSEGEAGPQARKGLRLMKAIREQSDLQVEACDESFSTQAAAGARGTRGASRARQKEALDAVAAAFILQEYLDTHAGSA
ncbi:MAG: Holliday junction resolvase RuvX [Chloroflexi bacterium]|nr:Holliday junction resolvase RuvX [Chloroflexota bacterium]